MLWRCDCKHDFQDKQYGEGMRVMNRVQGSNLLKEASCTVCGKKHIIKIRTK
jgi:hypothetical protein